MPSLWVQQTSNSAGSRLNSQWRPSTLVLVLVSWKQTKIAIIQYYGTSRQQRSWSRGSANYCAYRKPETGSFVNQAKNTVLWNRNFFLRFRFRFLLLKSFGSGSGSDFWKSYGSGSGSYFWKVTVPVPVPVPAPYLDHKKQIFQEYFWNFFSLFTL